MSTLEKAIEIAAKAHTGQTDKGGDPYIMHPLRLMFSVSGNDERIAAVLHDVVEDSDTSLDDLRNAGFSEAIVAAVDNLTKRKGETRLDAAQRAALSPISLAVKLADVTDNMNLTRIKEPSEKDLVRLEEYKAVKEFLLSKQNA